MTDLILFNELIKDIPPDVEVDEILFAYSSDRFNVVITKVSEAQVGIKTISMYKVIVAGELNVKRFVNNLENAMIKASFLVNDHFKDDLFSTDTEFGEEDYEFIARTFINESEY